MAVHTVIVFFGNLLHTKKMCNIPNTSSLHCMGAGGKEEDVVLPAILWSKQTEEREILGTYSQKSSIFLCEFYTVNTLGH